MYPSVGSVPRRRTGGRRGANDHRGRPKDGRCLQRRIQGEQGCPEGREGTEEGLHRGLQRSSTQHPDADWECRYPGKPAAPQPTPVSQAAAPSGSAPSATPPARRNATTAIGESACANGYAHLPASHTAAQICDEAQAKSRCPGQSVASVNTNSKIFHVAGSNTYGHTKEGIYSETRPCCHRRPSDCDAGLRTVRLSGPE